MDWPISWNDVKEELDKKPVIDLSEYEVDGTSISDRIFGMGLAGGGTATLKTGLEDFWTKIAELEPQFLILKNGDVTVRTTVDAYISTDSGHIEFNSSFIIVGTTPAKITYHLSSYGRGSALFGINIYVLAEPIAFPGS